MSDASDAYVRKHVSLNGEPIQKFSQTSLELSEVYDGTSYANNQYKHNVSVLGRKKEFSVQFRFPTDYQTF